MEQPLYPKLQNRDNLLSIIVDDDGSGKLRKGQKEKSIFLIYIFTIDF